MYRILQEALANIARHSGAAQVEIRLVWEDDQGRVWLSYNSADYLYNTISPRHGLAGPPSTAPFAKALDEMSDQATK